MTYAQLKQWIETLSAEQQQCDVSLHDELNDEWYSLAGKAGDMGIITPPCDVLDENHPVIAFNIPAEDEDENS